MIIKGNPAGSVAFWSSHLLRDDTNERAEVVEMRGLLAEDLPTALREMEAIAAGSRCHGNFMYSANINPGLGENLTPAQWTEAVDALEKNLGLEGHQRVVVEHAKEGRTHRHVVWNRVDVETLRVADMGGNYRIHTATSRELESRFDLSPTPSPASSLDHKRAPELWEARAAERSGINPADVKQELTEIWKQADNGKAFAAAIEERGYILAKGDRRDFVVIDQAGDAHSLARRLDGVKTADLRERMADVERDSLPSVSEGRALQADRAGLEIEPAPAPEVAKTAPEIKGPPLDQVRVADAVKKPALLVMDAATGAADTLSNFLSSMGGPSKPDPAMPAALQKMKEQRRALAALERIRESIEAGETLRPSDIQHLTPTHIENLKRHGDDYLRSLVEQAERRRALEQDYGRTRER